MALSGRAKWGAGAVAVLAVAAAGTAYVASRPDAPAIVSAPMAAATSAASALLPGAKTGKTASAKAPEKTMWKDLTPVQQQALEPLSAEWDQMEPIRKQKWLGIVKRYASMKPDEQARVQERMREWVKMTPEERRQVRQNFARAQKIDPSQKTTQWESYQQLPEEQKKELAAKAAIKKQVANLPTPTQSKIKTVAPIKPAVPTTGGPAVAPAAAPTAAAVTPVAPGIDPATGAPIPNASNIAPAVAPAAPAAPGTVQPAPPASSNVK